MSIYAIKTLGCKVNQFETEAIGLALEQYGWLKAGKNQPADLCIINTCTVTGKASIQSRQAIKTIIKKNPEAKIIVTGCYAQTEADEIKKIEGVHSIISHSEKHKIPGMIVTESGVPTISMDCNTSCSATEFEAIDIDVHGNRTRPFLKIQDGCNAFCTYCIVPHTRGRSRSMSPDLVLERLWALNEIGYKEIVLTGIHIGHWGADLSPAHDFTKLLKRIETENPVQRIRLSSIEPFEISDELIELFGASKLFCNHFHIPLQSGDDTILKRMHRPYTGAFFKQRVEKIYNTIPDVSIGADTLIGFPGETDDEFENTYNLIKELPLAYLHVFPFSPRKGTPAASFKDQVTDTLKKERTEKMRQLGELKQAAFVNSQIGKTADVLIENERDKQTGNLKGLSSNYVTIQTTGTDSLKKSIVKVAIDTISEGIISGQVISGKNK